MLDIESLYEVEAGVLIEAEAPTQIGIIFNNAPYNPRYQYNSEKRSMRGRCTNISPDEHYLPEVNL
jgi:hypothetical protein